jgi:hypothetical protein
MLFCWLRCKSVPGNFLLEDLAIKPDMKKIRIIILSLIFVVSLASLIYGKEIACGACNGTGKCPACQGTGETRCNTCQGTGSQRCGVCSGKGKTTMLTPDGPVEQACIRCDGTGKIACTSCMGSGTHKCYQCRGGACIYCRGTGRQYVASFGND